MMSGLAAHRHRAAVAADAKAPVRYRTGASIEGLSFPVNRPRRWINAAPPPLVSDCRVFDCRPRRAALKLPHMGTTAARPKVHLESTINAQRLHRRDRARIGEAVCVVSKLEFGRQVSVDLKADANFDERWGGPGHWSSPLKYQRSLSRTGLSHNHVPRQGSCKRRLLAGHAVAPRDHFEPRKRKPRLHLQESRGSGLGPVVGG